jgi:hypothetical protein
MQKSSPVASATAVCMTKFSSDLAVLETGGLLEAAARKNVHKIYGRLVFRRCLVGPRRGTGEETQSSPRVF